jgi:hypothetical protein
VLRHNSETGRCRIGTRPRAGQGPVWAVPEESLDEGGGSVTVTVTVSGGAVTVSGGVVTRHRRRPIRNALTGCSKLP